VNVDNREHFTEVAAVLEKNLPTPKKKKNRA
jgi:hypothetical protein